MLFFLQTDCFHERKLQTDCFDERTKFWIFQKNWKCIFNIWKNQPKKSTKKIATPVSRIRRFWSKLKGPPKLLFFFLQAVCFHERTTFWLFQNNLKGTFNISKNQSKKWPRRYGPATAILVKIEQSPKHAVFASNWVFSWKMKILNVSEEFERYFQHLKKST